MQNEYFTIKEYKVLLITSVVINLVLVSLVILTSACYHGMKNHMIENGYAEYRIDPKTGASEFYLIPKQELPIEK